MGDQAALREMQRFQRKFDITTTLNNVPLFYGNNQEDVGEFLDSYRIHCLAIQLTDEEKARHFPIFRRQNALRQY